MKTTINVVTLTLMLIASVVINYSVEEKINASRVNVPTYSKKPVERHIKIDRATRYNAVEGQCDSSPLVTADGTYIDKSALAKGDLRIVALSWDLIYDKYRQDVRSEDWAWRGEFKFGDTIHVESKSSPFINGKWVVADAMNGRYRRSIDFLCHEDNKGPKLGVCKDLIIKID